MADKVNWGVIGCGGIADRRTIPGMMLAKNAKLYAVMDVNETVAKSVCEKYGAEKYYTDAASLIADPAVEAVYIASPVMFHTEQVLAAAKAGKHVLCEKPLCLTSEQSAEAEKFCAEKGVKAAVGLMMRYHAHHQRMREMIASGKLGQVVSLRAQLNCWFPDIPGNWRQVKATTGGGALIDMGIHCLDLIEYIAGSKTKKAFGFCDTKTFKYDVDDSANALVLLENGAVGYVDVNYNVPDDACSCRLEVMGTGGSLIAEGTVGQEERGTLTCIFSDQKDYNAAQQRKEPERLTFGDPDGNMYTKEIESFSDSILNGTPVEVPMSDAIPLQRAIEAIYKASDEGKVEEL